MNHTQYTGNGNKFNYFVPGYQLRRWVKLESSPFCLPLLSPLLDNYISKIRFYQIKNNIHLGSALIIIK